MSDIQNRIENVTNILQQDTARIQNLPNYLDTSDADATVEDLAEGVTAYVKGVKLTGMANTGTINIADYIYITDYDTNTISVSGKTSGSDVSHLIYPNSSRITIQVLKDDMATYANLTPEILKQGETVLGVVGTFEGGGGSLKLIDGSKLACSTFKDYPNYDVSNIKDMSNMFYQCENLENISNLNMTNATSIYNMFQGCWSLSTDTCNNIANFIPNSNQVGAKTIYEAGIEASRFDSEAKEILYSKGYLDTYNGYEDMIEVYNICSDGTWTNDLTPEYGYPSTIYGGGLIELLSQYTLGETTNIIIESNKPNAVLLMMSNMFQYKTSLTDLTLNINTANLLIMSNTFEGCESLVNISNFDTSNVINMSYAFVRCSSLENLPNFDTSNVINMCEAFSQCENLVNIPNFNTINVADMTRAFSQTGINTIPNFNTSNVKNMNFMFISCYNLESIPNFNTINVKHMFGTFIDCAITNVPNFNTSNVVEMASTFWNCANLIDVPQFNTSNVSNMSGMFGECNNLSNASIQNIINMCLNSNVPAENRTLVTDAYSSPFFQTQFDNSYYTNRLTELDTAGWTY